MERRTVSGSLPASPSIGESHDIRTKTFAPAHGVLLAAGGAVLFSTKAVLVKLAYAYPLSPITLLTLRMAFAMPAFLIAAIRCGGNGSFSRSDLARAMLFGLIGYHGASFLDFAGLERISASVERLILYTYPAMVVLLSAFAFKRPVAGREAAALGLTYGGVSLVVADDMPNLQATPGWITGALLVLSSAFAYAIYLIGSQRLIPRLGATRYTAMAMLAAIGGVALHFLLSRAWAELSRLPIAIYAYGAALGLFATVLPSFMTSAAIARIGAAKTAIIGAVGPVATLILAWALLGEPVSVAQIVGTIVVIYGVGVISK